MIVIQAVWWGCCWTSGRRPLLRCKCGRLHRCCGGLADPAQGGRDGALKTLWHAALPPPSFQNPSCCSTSHLDSTGLQTPLTFVPHSSHPSIHRHSFPFPTWVNSTHPPSHPPAGAPAQPGSTTLPRPPRRHRGARRARLRRLRPGRPHRAACLPGAQAGRLRPHPGRPRGALRRRCRVARGERFCHPQLTPLGPIARRRAGGPAALSAVHLREPAAAPARRRHQPAAKPSLRRAATG